MLSGFTYLLSQPLEITSATTKEELLATGRLKTIDDIARELALLDSTAKQSLMIKRLSEKIVMLLKNSPQAFSQVIKLINAIKIGPSNSKAALELFGKKITADLIRSQAISSREVDNFLTGQNNPGNKLKLLYLLQNKEILGQLEVSRACLSAQIECAKQAEGYLDISLTQWVNSTHLAARILLLPPSDCLELLKQLTLDKNGSSEINQTNAEGIFTHEKFLTTLREQIKINSVAYAPVWNYCIARLSSETSKLFFLAEIGLIKSKNDYLWIKATDLSDNNIDTDAEAINQYVDLNQVDFFLLLKRIIETKPNPSARESVFDPFMELSQLFTAYIPDPAQQKVILESDCYTNYFNQKASEIPLSEHEWYLAKSKFEVLLQHYISPFADKISALKCIASLLGGNSADHYFIQHPILGIKDLKGNDCKKAANIIAEKLRSKLITKDHPDQKISLLTTYLLALPENIQFHLLNRPDFIAMLFPIKTGGTIADLSIAYRLYQHEINHWNQNRYEATASASCQLLVAHHFFESYIFTNSYGKNSTPETKKYLGHLNKLLEQSKSPLRTNIFFITAEKSSEAIPKNNHCKINTLFKGYQDQFISVNFPEIRKQLNEFITKNRPNSESTKVAIEISNYLQQHNIATGATPPPETIFTYIEELERKAFELTKAYKHIYSSLRAASKTNMYEYYAPHSAGKELLGIIRKIVSWLMRKLDIEQLYQLTNILLEYDNLPDNQNTANDGSAATRGTSEQSDGDRNQKERDKQKTLTHHQGEEPMTEITGATAPPMRLMHGSDGLSPAATPVAKPLEPGEDDGSAATAVATYSEWPEAPTHTPVIEATVIDPQNLEQQQPAKRETNKAAVLGSAPQQETAKDEKYSVTTSPAHMWNNWGKNDCKVTEEDLTTGPASDVRRP